MKNYIFLISGAPGAGKSTIAKAMLKRYDKGVYLSLDDFRKFVVSGYAPPMPSTSTSEEQALLAYENATCCALNYFKKGYTVILDEVASKPDTIKGYINLEESFKTILVLPNLAVNIERNLSRKNKSFDTTVLNEFIKSFHQKMQRRKDQWDIIIDNSDLSIEHTVKLIIKDL